jgi:hypothetical protein
MPHLLSSVVLLLIGISVVVALPPPPPPPSPHHPANYSTALRLERANILLRLWRIESKLEATRADDNTAAASSERKAAAAATTAAPSAAATTTKTTAASTSGLPASSTTATKATTCKEHTTLHAAAAASAAKTVPLSLRQERAWLRVLSLLKAARPVEIVALGGSTMLGNGCEDREIRAQECSYTARFARALRCRYYGVANERALPTSAYGAEAATSGSRSGSGGGVGMITYENRGRGGSTTASALPQLDKLVRAEDNAPPPDLVFLDFALNDAVESQDWGARVTSAKTHDEQQPGGHDSHGGGSGLHETITAVTEALLKYLTETFPNTAFMLVEGTCVSMWYGGGEHHSWSQQTGEAAYVPPSIRKSVRSPFFPSCARSTNLVSFLFTSTNGLILPLLSHPRLRCEPTTKIHYSFVTLHPFPVTSASAHERVAAAYGVPFLSLPKLTSCDLLPKPKEGQSLHYPYKVHEELNDVLLAWVEAFEASHQPSNFSFSSSSSSPSFDKNEPPPPMHVTPPTKAELAPKELQDKYRVCPEQLALYNAPQLAATTGLDNSAAAAAAAAADSADFSSAATPNAAQPPLESLVPVTPGDQWKLCEDRPGKFRWVTDEPGAVIEFPLRFGSSPRVTVVYTVSYASFGNAKFTMSTRWYRSQLDKSRSSTHKWTEGYFITLLGAHSSHTTLSHAEVVNVHQDGVDHRGPSGVRGFGVQPHTNATLRLQFFPSKAQVRSNATSKFAVIHVSSC